MTGWVWGSLALLVQRVTQPHAEDVVDSLCAKLLSGKREQERDVAAIGLKTVVTDLPNGALATLVVRRLCPKLVAGVQTKARPAPLHVSYVSYTLYVPTHGRRA